MPESSACNFTKKETLAQVFSCEFCESFKNTFLAEHIWVTAFVMLTFSFMHYYSKLTLVIIFKLALK